MKVSAVQQKVTNVVSQQNKAQAQPNFKGLVHFSNGMINTDLIEVVAPNNDRHKTNIYTSSGKTFVVKDMYENVSRAITSASESRDSNRYLQYSSIVSEVYPQVNVLNLNKSNSDKAEPKTSNTKQKLNVVC